jgi:hypothetical protein
MCAAVKTSTRNGGRRGACDGIEALFPQRAENERKHGKDQHADDGKDEPIYEPGLRVALPLGDVKEGLYLLRLHGVRLLQLPDCVADFCE